MQRGRRSPFVCSVLRRSLRRRRAYVRAVISLFSVPRRAAQHRRGARHDLYRSPQLRLAMRVPRRHLDDGRRRPRRGGRDVGGEVADEAGVSPEPERLAETGALISRGGGERHLEVDRRAEIGLQVLLLERRVVGALDRHGVIAGDDFAEPEFALRIGDARSVQAGVQRALDRDGGTLDGGPVLAEDDSHDVRRYVRLRAPARGDDKRDQHRCASNDRSIQHAFLLPGLRRRLAPRGDPF